MFYDNIILSLFLIPKTMPKRPFILNIPIFLEIQFSLWRLLSHEPSERAQQNSRGKTAYLLWIVLKALGEVINKNRCWQGYKEKSFRAEDNL